MLNRAFTFAIYHKNFLKKNSPVNQNPRHETQYYAKLLWEVHVFTIVSIGIKTMTVWGRGMVVETSQDPA